MNSDNEKYVDASDMYQKKSKTLIDIARIVFSKEGELNAFKCDLMMVGDD